MNYANILYHLTPEIWITVLIFVILGLDLFFLRNKPLTIRNQTVGLTTGLGLALITIWIVLKQLSVIEPVRLLGDMFVLDPMTVFIKVILMVKPSLPSFLPSTASSQPTFLNFIPCSFLPYWE